MTIDIIQPEIDYKVIKEFAEGSEIQIIKPYIVGKSPMYESFEERVKAHQVHVEVADALGLGHVIQDISLNKEDTEWGYWVVKTVSMINGLIPVADIDIENSDSQIIQGVIDALIVMIGIVENTDYLPDHKFNSKGYIVPVFKRIHIWDVASTENILVSPSKVVLDSDCLIPNQTFSRLAGYNLKIQIGQYVSHLKHILQHSPLPQIETKIQYS